jgi:hypothetical protein
VTTPVATRALAQGPDSIASNWLDDAARWSEGRLWQWRVPLLAALAWIGVRHLAEPEYWSIFMGLTLALHEIGHILFAPFGETMSVAGGSITQLAAPVAAALVLRRQRDWFGVAVAGCWLAFSLANLGTYIGDARAGELPLVSVGDGEEVIHDWSYLLDLAGWLHLDASFARLARVLSGGVLASSVLFGGWLCRRMMRSRAKTSA